MNINERFESVNDDFIKFEKVEAKRSNRPDLHAFILLDEIFPESKDMIGGAAHDEIWLEAGAEKLDQLTDGQILELTRCGVRYDSDCDCLAMFV